MASNERFLLTGANGWICGQIHALLESQGKTVHSTTVRMEDLSAMSKVFDDFQPTRVINCAGKTGRPNVDWCEDHRDETVMANVVGTLMLAHLCHERGVHMTNMATGCMSNPILVVEVSVTSKTDDAVRHLHLRLHRRPLADCQQAFHRE